MCGVGQYTWEAVYARMRAHCAIRIKSLVTGPPGAFYIHACAQTRIIKVGITLDQPRALGSHSRGYHPPPVLILA